MLAVAPLRHAKDEGHGGMDGFSIGADEDFPDFSDGNLLDSIDFDDLFVDINVGDDELPDLEMDPELLAEFSISSTYGGDESDINTSVVSPSVGILFEDRMRGEEEDEEEEEEDDKVSGSGSAGSSSSRGGEEIVSKREEEEETVAAKSSSSSIKDGHEKGRKSSSSHVKNSHGKRKVKVDWTPELHRRFVQAVEQLGVDKAVPSRILEIMGIDCLTRHNIASHLQKYRSHRKHLLAREAEAASWSQRRQMYGAAAAAAGGGGKREMNPWLAPTMGFPPPMTPPPPPPPMHHFRPLHVWGHPSVDQSLMHMWPKHLAHSPSPPPQQPPPPPPLWAPPPHHPPPSVDPSYWHHHHHQRVPNGLTPGTPFFPPPQLATTRFAAPPVPGIIPPHAMYKLDPGMGVPNGQSGNPPHFDLHPSKESIDAAIGDVISKPWLPLPLGLKPPSLDGVLVELQRQGVPKIPPATSACS